MASLRNGYGRAYASLLGSRFKAIDTIVELGVFQGASLAIWCDLFPQAKIIGLDIEFDRFESHRAFLKGVGAFLGNSPELVSFDAFAPVTNGLIDQLGGRRIDLFIDDGPHHIDAIVATAIAVMPLMGEGSLYVVEDQAGALAPLRDAFPSIAFRMEGQLVVGEVGSRVI
jgi:cephalosporin hydroxylase